MIERNQNQHGLNKKLLCVSNRVHQHDTLDQLKFIDHPFVANTIELETLQVGRPHMNPMTVSPLHR